jgi:hemerythrin-like domain-containing protein
LRKHAETDHQTTYKLVAAINNNKNNKILLIQLAEELEKHIRFEERVLFNHVQNNITAEELEVITKRFSNSSEAIDEKWKDTFWILKK